MRMLLLLALLALIPKPIYAATPARFDDVAVKNAVAIGVSGSTVASTKAILELVSTTKGVLFPRMTTTQRDAIASPVAGLILFNTTTSSLNAYTGAAWVQGATLTGTEVFTNKTMSGSSNTFSNIGDSSLSVSYLKADGSRGLSAHWNAGSFNITATTFIGALTGNASTATALVANPAPCGAGDFVTDMAADGTLTCGTPSGSTGKTTGEVFMFAGSACPSGSLEANGANLLRSGGTSCGGGSCANLFTAISTAHGTADGTHFNIPDLRGKFPRGYDHAAANDPDRASRTACNTGGATADNIGTCQANATKKNGMTITDPGHIHTLTAGSPVAGATTQPWEIGDGNGGYSNNTSSNTTGITLITGDNETRPINVSLIFCIQY